VMAADDIQVGTKLEAHDVRVVTLPQSAVPPGAFSGTSQVLGRGAILPVSKGESFAEQTGGSERRNRPALDDPAGYASSFRACQRCGFGGGALCNRARTWMCWLLVKARQRPSNYHRPGKRLGAGRGKSLDRNPLADAQTAPVITLAVSSG